MNEGFKILDEGIAQRPSDIDIGWVFGMGYPMSKGGPMLSADRFVGLNKLEEGLKG